MAREKVDLRVSEDLEELSDASARALGHVAEERSSGGSTAPPHDLDPLKIGAMTGGP